MDNSNTHSIANRIKAETPAFFKKVRTLMIGIGGVGLAIVTSQAALPHFIASIGGYLVTIGAVGSALSQLTTKTDK